LPQSRAPHGGGASAVPQPRFSPGAAPTPRNPADS
jgi:hypothetical protein